METPSLPEPNQMLDPTELNREQRGFQKSDPGGDQRYIMVREYISVQYQRKKTTEKVVDSVSMEEYAAV